MTTTPKIVPTNQIPHEEIDPDALKVIGRLRRFGHEAYLVGGCVRDLLLNAHPKDFDVITSARPRQVRRIFSNSRVIGRRFRLVHVIFGENIIEVSTFRADPGQFAEQAELAGATPEGEAGAEEGEGSSESAAASAVSGEVASGDAPLTTDEGGTGEAHAATSTAHPLMSTTPIGALPAPPKTGVFTRDEVDATAEEHPEPPAPKAGESGRLVGIRPETVPGTEATGALGETGVHAPVTPLEAAHQLSLEPAAELATPTESHARPAPRRMRDTRYADNDAADEEELDDADWDPRRGRRRRPRPEFDGNNIFGTPEEDARRRDFTINALFYDPERREIIDWVDGLRDIERGLVNPINDPLLSFAEDPVRMIRAVRFAAKLGFEIEKNALNAINEKKVHITSCSQRRILEEIFKILKGGHAAASLRTLEETGILSTLIPEVGEWVALEGPLPGLAAAHANGSAHMLPLEAGVPGVPSDPGAPAPATSEAETPASATPAASTPTHAASAPDASESSRAPAHESSEGAKTHAFPESKTPAPAAPAEPAHASPAASADHAPASPASEPPVPGSSAHESHAAPAPTTIPASAAPTPPEEIRLGPIPSWEPPAKAIEAYLRVMWEHPPKEGPNDWVEDPHEEVEDAVFEAAAFARDVVLERSGLTNLVGLPSERSRARAVMKILQLNNRLADAIAWVEEQARVDEAVSRSAREGRRDGRGRGRDGRGRDSRGRDGRGRDSRGRDGRGRDGRDGRRFGQGRGRDFSSSDRTDRAEIAEHRARDTSPMILESKARPVPAGLLVPGVKPFATAAAIAAGPTPSTTLRRPPTTRREVLHRYLEGLDRLIVEGVPLTTGVQLAALYGPMLREALDGVLEKRGAGAGSAETVIDDILRPIALRHSLARRDRDRVKRIVLAMRRLLRDNPPKASTDAGGRGRRRSRGGQRILGKDYFQESLVLLWLHARATGEGWEPFRHWEARALAEKRETARPEGDLREGGQRRGDEWRDSDEDSDDEDDFDDDLDDDEGDEDGDDRDAVDRDPGERGRGDREPGDRGPSRGSSSRGGSRGGSRRDGPRRGGPPGRSGPRSSGGRR